MQVLGLQLLNCHKLNNVTQFILCNIYATAVVISVVYQIMQKMSNSHTIVINHTTSVPLYCIAKVNTTCYCIADFEFMPD